MAQWIVKICSMIFRMLFNEKEGGVWEIYWRLLIVDKGQTTTTTRCLELVNGLICLFEFLFLPLFLSFSIQPHFPKCANKLPFKGVLKKQNPGKPFLVKNGWNPGPPLFKWSWSYYLKFNFSRHNNDTDRSQTERGCSRWQLACFAITLWFIRTVQRKQWSSAEKITK